jgi:predicted flavoprotein YhiN
MNRKHCLFLFVLLLPCFLHAQLLYQISGNGTNSKSYLLATNQLVNKTFLDTIPNVFTVFSRCDKVITEFAIEDYEAIGMNAAEITFGGVDTTDISSKTMESLLCSGLFFTGEVMDISGDLGGFNLQWAFSSGVVAGRNA